jgi:hypothetical protein
VAELKLVREHSYFGIARGVVIDIDGKRAAVVRAGSGKTLHLPEGPHQLRARMDWVRSKILSFDLTGDGVTTIRISVPFWSGVLATITAGKAKTFAFDVVRD